MYSQTTNVTCKAVINILGPLSWFHKFQLTHLFTYQFTANFSYQFHRRQLKERNIQQSTNWSENSSWAGRRHLHDSAFNRL